MLCRIACLMNDPSWQWSIQTGTIFPAIPVYILTNTRFQSVCGHTKSIYENVSTTNAANGLCICYNLTSEWEWRQWFVWIQLCTLGKYWQVYCLTLTWVNYLQLRHVCISAFSFNHKVCDCKWLFVQRTVLILLRKPRNWKCSLSCIVKFWLFLLVVCHQTSTQGQTTATSEWLKQFNVQLAFNHSSLESKLFILKLLLMILIMMIHEFLNKFIQLKNAILIVLI